LHRSADKSDVWRYITRPDAVCHALARR